VARAISGKWIKHLGVLFTVIVISGTACAQSVLTYHGNADRSGNFVVPALTWERAPNIHLDPSFHPRITGHLYAQPLYWRPPGSAAGQLLVATEDNNVYAIDTGSGREIWARQLGKPVPLSTLECGNIDPLGITGTPVIDEATQAVYLNAMVAGTAGPRHRVLALSLKDGSPLPGLAGRCRRSACGARPALQRALPEPAGRAHHPRRTRLCPLRRSLR
jgi:PQQ enzyme repeat